jgi:UDP-N-acetylglucosamine--dolichyl-phosphate N-acetylglucosaminephosphotransferase
MAFVFGVVFLAAFLVTSVFTPRLIPKLVEADLTGHDKNKVGEPLVAEMGGLCVIAGFVFAVLLAVAFSSFQVLERLGEFRINLASLFAGLLTVLIMSLIGIFDDIFDVKQHVKAALPLIASLPLVAINVGESFMNLPLVGPVEFGVLYPLLFIPLAITGASNAMNMLAGFNGLEAGLGAVMCAAIGLVSLRTGSVEAAVLSFAMMGALLAFLRYNWFPARILPGDVGTLSVGAVVASSVILGNIEKLGMVLILPFFAELYLKMRSRFKAESWCERRGGKLVCPNRREVYGLGRLVMYFSGGISERDLVLVLLSVEVVFALVGVSLYF